MNLARRCRQCHARSRLPAIIHIDMTATIEVAIQFIDHYLLLVYHALYTNMISHYDTSFHLGLGGEVALKE